MVAIVCDDDGHVQQIHLRPDGAAESTSPIVVVRKEMAARLRSNPGTFTRSQFPILPAYAVTVHRVQGATLEGDIHILLNDEFFADGMRTATNLQPLRATTA